MKIIFLDFDGVLNHEAFYINRQDSLQKGIPMLEYPLSELDPKSISALNFIIEKTDAKVVVSSTWRHGRKIEELQDILNKVGFKGEIIDKTPDLHFDGAVRGNEILKWIRDHIELIGKNYHEFETYVIFDDDSDMLYWQRNNFIHVDRWVGLTIRDAYRAIKLLNGGGNSDLIIM